MATYQTDTFECFCRQELPQLVRHLLMQGFSHDVAAESAQEAMVRAYLHWETIDDPRAWTRTTARRIAAKEARRIQTLVYELEQLGGQAEDDAWSWLTMKDEQTEILEAIATLPEQQRVVMAWHFDGYKPHEIAAELDMLPSTVSSNLRHARKRLKQLLEKGRG